MTQPRIAAVVSVVNVVNVVSVVGAACLALGLFTACGDAEPGAADGGDPENSPPESSASEAARELSGEVTVLAAASLTEVFEALADRFEQMHPDTEVIFSFAASSELAAQVVAGAPADVLATANTSTMDLVVADDLTATPPEIFAGNVLQIAVPPDNPGGVRSLADLANADLTVALCAPEVPCGAAAIALLELVGVSVEPDTLEPDVRSALTKVELGEVDVALVYRTDVGAAGDGVEGIDVPEAEQVVNEYPIAALDGAPNPAAAAAFVDLVLSPAGVEALEAAGFQRP